MERWPLSSCGYFSKRTYMSVTNSTLYASFCDAHDLVRFERGRERRDERGGERRAALASSQTGAGGSRSWLVLYLFGQSSTLGGHRLVARKRQPLFSSHPLADSPSLQDKKTMCVCVCENFNRIYGPVVYGHDARPCDGRRRNEVNTADSQKATVAHRSNSGGVTQCTIRTNYSSTRCE